MSRTSCRVLVLLAVLAMQALGVAHAFGHPALDHGNHACAVCAHGAGLDHVPPPAAPAYAALAAARLPAPERATAPATGVTLAYRSRGPPFLPA